MRLIKYKLKVTELNLIGILKLFRLVFKNIPGIRFEIVETHTSFQLKFMLVKSKLSRVERFWLRSKLKTFIRHEPK